MIILVKQPLFLGVLAVLTSATAPLLAITPRTIDGSNNNLANFALGQANTQEIRLTPANYFDGISIIRTDIHGRPNARELSTRIFSQSATEHFLDENGLNEMTWAWGQFVDHDINFTDDGAETHEITIPDDDAGFALDSDGMITFKRKSFTPGTGTSTENPRQFNNFITAWIDASLVYGSDPTRASALRDNGGTGAKLRTHEYGDPDTDRDNLLPTADDLISAGVPLPPSERVRFEAGDVRSNENTAILALHTLMLREHNRIVDAMSVADPGMTDEEKYQIAKKIVGAEMQAITYNDYLPALGVHVDTSGGYDPNVDPRISVEFSQGVFRMGHTSINEQAPRLNNDLTPHEAGPITLEQTFFNPTAIFETGVIEPFLLGLISSVQEATDAKMVPGLRDLLFQFGPTSMINDLAAIDIERGRDIGLSDYNEVRAALGLKPVSTFADITSDLALQASLSDLYGDVNDIDLWVGMLAEDHLPGMSFGLTILTAMEDQFERLASGDRFFYQWDEDIATIEADYGISVLDSLASLMLANTDIPASSIVNPSNIFVAPEPSTLLVMLLATLVATNSRRRRTRRR